jgi:hypothetical protein
VTGYFSRTVAELDSAGEKLDDRMQPLLDSQCGAVVKSTDRKYTRHRFLSSLFFSEFVFGFCFICIGFRFI